MRDREESAQVNYCCEFTSYDNLITLFSWCIKLVWPTCTCVRTYNRQFTSTV